MNKKGPASAGPFFIAGDYGIWREHPVQYQRKKLNMSNRISKSTLVCLTGAAMLLISIFIGGCASTDDDRIRRGNLSEAMQKASDKNNGSRQVADSRLENPHDQTYPCNEPVWRNNNCDNTPTGGSGRRNVSESRYTESYYPDSIGLSIKLVGDSSNTVLNLLQGMRRYDAVPLIFEGKQITELTVTTSDTETALERHYTIRRDLDSATRSGLYTYSVQIRKEKPDCYLGLRAISGDSYSPYYSGIYGAALVLLINSGNKEQHMIDLGATDLALTGKSDLAGSISDIGQAYLGYEYRHYFAAHNRLFWSIGGEIKILFWDYKNVIRSNVYNANGNIVRSDTVSSDGIQGFSGNIGCGIALLKTENVLINFECTAGGSLFYWGQTLAGFNNDLFNGDMFVKGIFEIAFGQRLTPDQ